MRRTKSEIISEILDICVKGANKTRIVYQANMNFRTINPYLNTLIKNELLDTIESNKSRKIYKTTDKGLILKDLLEI